MPSRWRFSRLFRRIASADFPCCLNEQRRPPLCATRLQGRSRHSQARERQSVLAARLRARKRCRVLLIAHLSRRAARTAEGNPPRAVAVFVVAVPPAPTLLVAPCLSASVRFLKAGCRVVPRRATWGSYRASVSLPAEAQPCGRPRSLRSLDAAR
jgi:hypothetical protein